MDTLFSKPRFFAHIALGGAICLFATSILATLSSIGIRLLLFNFGNLGLLAFSESASAISLFMIGTAYLPSGFFGGLYTGRKINENLKIILLLPALIGVAGTFIVRFLTGYIDLSAFSLQDEILIPLLGNLVGSYLGGYTMNWEAEETKPSKTIKLKRAQIKPLPASKKKQKLRWLTLKF